MVPDNPKKGRTTYNPQHWQGKMSFSLFRQVLYLIAVAIFLAGCARSPGDLFDEMMATDNNEDFRLLSGEAMALGRDSIPIFLALLSREVPPDRKLSVIELSKDGVCLTRLNDLAKEGIYSIYEIPVLLRHMEQEPLNLQASLIPAETLKIITGLDVGYDARFVESYTKADEPKRRQMLAVWRSWYEQKVASRH